MGDDQMMQVLGELAQMTLGARNDKGGIALVPQRAPEPFDFKGEQLGTTLADFKTRHARRVGKVELPYTSESSRGQANAALWSEAWHAAAGIVHARIELPSENASPTVAGVKTQLFIYQFVDGLLFRMTGLFDAEAFHVVRQGFVDKHGAPQQECADPVELVWNNGASSIHLVRGSIRPKRASMVVFSHDELAATAELRTPRRGEDL